MLAEPPNVQRDASARVKLVWRRPRGHLRLTSTREAAPVRSIIARAALLDDTGTGQSHPACIGSLPSIPIGM
jgi:hypothetical protein